MTKADLKSGMQVLLANGTKGLLVQIEDRLLIQFKESFSSLKCYNNDLTNRFDYSNSIVKVYKTSSGRYIIRKNLCTSESDVIFDRKRDGIREFTLKEIAEAVGVNVHQLRIKE